MKLVVCAVALVAASLFATPANSATGDRVEYKAALKRATADYNAAMKQCRARPASERTLCRTEAKATARRAEADAEAAYRNTPQARFDARVAGANGDYSVDRVKCRAMGAEERKGCLKAAKTRQSDAIVAAINTEHVRPRGPQIPKSAPAGGARADTGASGTTDGTSSKRASSTGAPSAKAVSDAPRPADSTPAGKASDAAK